MQTKKVLNSTIYIGNMKILRSFVGLNLYMVFKAPECLSTQNPHPSLRPSPGEVRALHVVV